MVNMLITSLINHLVHMKSEHFVQYSTVNTVKIRTALDFLK